MEAGRPLTAVCVFRSKGGFSCLSRLEWTGPISRSPRTSAMSAATQSDHIAHLLVSLDGFRRRFRLHFLVKSVSDANHFKNVVRDPWFVTKSLVDGGGIGHGGGRGRLLPGYRPIGRFRQLRSDSYWLKSATSIAKRLGYLRCCGGCGA